MKIKQFFNQLDFSWRSIRDYLLIISGSLVQALALRTFLIPAQLVGGGISGIAQLLHYLWRTPVGLITLLGNIPLFIIGWRYLGGPRFAVRTILSVVSFTIFADVLIEVTGQAPITEDILLNSLYGGLLLGVGDARNQRHRGCGDPSLQHVGLLLGLDYLSPVKVMPSMKRRCASRKATTSGVMITIAAAISGP